MEIFVHNLASFQLIKYYTTITYLKIYEEQYYK